MANFILDTSMSPKGDQEEAIEKLVSNIENSLVTKISNAYKDFF